MNLKGKIKPGQQIIAVRTSRDYEAERIQKTSQRIYIEKPEPAIVGTVGIKYFQLQGSDRKHPLNQDLARSHDPEYRIRFYLSMEDYIQQKEMGLLRDRIFKYFRSWLSSTYSLKNHSLEELRQLEQLLYKHEKAES